MSAALSFQPVQVATRHAKVLLIGEAGTGKTHAALTFPKPAVIDAEGSADWFADRFGPFPVVTTKSYSDVTSLLRQVKAGRVPCETLVVDSLTSIYNGLVNAATEARMKGQFPSDDLRPLDWGRIKRKFSGLLDELYHKLPVNVVCVGWIKPEYAKPGDNVNGKVVNQNDLVKIGEVFDGDRKTMYAFDFVFKIEGNDGKRTRATVIKSRSGVLKAGQTIPDFSWATLEPLLPKGSAEATGMDDEEQVGRDASLFEQDETVTNRKPPDPAPQREAPPRAATPAKALPAAAPAPSAEEAADVGEVSVEVVSELLSRAIGKLHVASSKEGFIAWLHRTIPGTLSIKRSSDLRKRPKVVAAITSALDEVEANERQ